MKPQNVFYLLACSLLISLCGCKPKDSPKDDMENLTNARAYDIWFRVNKGTSTDPGADAHIVKNVPTLLEGEYTIEGNQGVDVTTSNITNHSIYHKGYYYSLNRQKEFGKYKITDKNIETVSRFPLSEIQDRRFAHAFLDDNTMVVIGAPGKKDVINWLKIDIENMRVIQKGTLAVTPLKDDELYSSGGILTYRKKDNKLLFCYRINEKKKANGQVIDKHTYFYIGTINPQTMEVEHIAKEYRVFETASVAFGNTIQDIQFIDKNGDLYIACNTINSDATSATKKHGSIIRIKAGEYETDKSYKIDLFENSKTITMHQIPGGKAILYLQNPMYATGKDVWSNKTNPYVFFWAVVDLATGEQRHLKEMPFSQGGNFSQLISVEKDYTILGINDQKQTRFFKYDYKTGKATEVSKFNEGVFADRIVKL